MMVPEPRASLIAPADDVSVTVPGVVTRPDGPNVIPATPDSPIAAPVTVPLIVTVPPVWFTVAAPLNLSA